MIADDLINAVDEMIHNFNLSIGISECDRATLLNWFRKVEISEIERSLDSQAAE